MSDIISSGKATAQPRAVVQGGGKPRPYYITILRSEVTQGLLATCDLMFVAKELHIIITKYIIIFTWQGTIELFHVVFLLPGHVLQVNRQPPLLFCLHCAIVILRSC